MLIFLPFCLLGNFLPFVPYIMNSNFPSCLFYYSLLLEAYVNSGIAFLQFPRPHCAVLNSTSQPVAIPFYFSPQVSEYIVFLKIYCEHKFVMFVNFTFVFNSKFFWGKYIYISILKKIYIYSLNRRCLFRARNCP